MLRAEQILQERYQIKKKLGGNLGHQVWLARDIKTYPAKLVVVKVLLIAKVTQWDELKLFEREAKILQQLNHPQIPKYLDYFSINNPINGFVLVQEYIPGKSLKNLIIQGNRFTKSQVRQIGVNILHILSYLHEFNPPVLHRDIKPSNLILGKDGYVYLIDFGAVQLRAAIEGSTFTVVGSYGYTPIEQFGGRAVPASDIYALGATLIHLLTGISPADLPQEDFAIKFADRVNLDPHFIAWLEKLIEPDITKRFNTTTEALEALRSGIVNNIKQSINFNHKTFDLTKEYAKPSKTNIQIEKSSHELIIKYTVPFVDNIFAIIIISLMLSVFILFDYFIVFSLIISLLIFILIAIYDSLFSIYLHFYGDTFEIYKYKNIGFSISILHKGLIKDIEDIFEYNIHGVKRNSFILIKTKQQECVYGQGLNKVECIWLVQEVKNWLTQS